MKIVQLIFIGFLFLALNSCSDLLGNEELQAEFEKQTDIECKYRVSIELSKTCHPLYVIDRKVYSQGTSPLSIVSAGDVSSLEIVSDSSDVPYFYKKSENYKWEGKFRGVVVITTKKSKQ